MLISILLGALLLTSATNVHSTITFTFTNKCDYSIHPGTLSGSSSPTLQSTGFQLLSGESRSLQAPPGWSGRFWGRTGCAFDPVTGKCLCTTADCGSNQIECNGAGAFPPATVAEITLASGSDTKDFYDVSLVDGFNLPMLVEPNGGSGDCSVTGSSVNLNKGCPSELQFGGGEACARPLGRQSIAAAVRMGHRRLVSRRLTRRCLRRRVRRLIAMRTMMARVRSHVAELITL